MSNAFKIAPEVLVEHSGERYLVIEVSDIETVMCRRLSSNETALLPVAELTPARDQELYASGKSRYIDLATIDNETWKEVSDRLEVLRELQAVGSHRRTKAQIEQASKRLGKSSQTIYRWLKKFENDGSVSGMLRKERSDKGLLQFDEEVELLIQDAIYRIMLKREAGTIKDVHTDVQMACQSKNLKVPGKTAIRDRYMAIPEKARVAARQGTRAAKERFSPLRGSFPGADHPLDVIQIDHTPADLIIVDEIYRKPIGRPTLTLAIDVYSRVVMGFNLWLEAPSAAAVGLCLRHALLPKESWLKERGIDASWPCYGKPRKVHTDNAKEFRGNVLGRACVAHGIDLEQRPRGAPHFGGTVERSFRTYLRRVHTLSGTTFSNTLSKFEYDSEGKAIFTLKEFEAWFTYYIAKIYHHEEHTGISYAPIARFKEGILGSSEKPGIGLPERVLDEESLRLDFLPYFERTVQEYGVLLDHIYYYDDSLRCRIHEKDPDNPKSARKFVFRRDPSDVSVLHFWDPDLKVYKRIPYAHLGRPPASLWEVRAAVRELAARGKASVDENSIFEGILAMREIESNAALATKAARRNEERRRRDAQSREAQPKHVTTSPVVQPEVRFQSPQAEPEDDDDIIVPFDDLDARV